jgi:hypothetical protein
MSTSLPPGSPRLELLTSALRRVGARPDDEVVVLVCDQHPSERALAHEAIELACSVVVDLDVEMPLPELEGELTSRRGRILLACQEGVSRWRETNVPMRVIGESSEPYVMWWRMLELKEFQRTLHA